MADREAPLGWVYLRVYKDKTFEFESKGLERKDVYVGTFEFKRDTLYFKYSDSIPIVGEKAHVDNNFVRYFEGKYPENLNISKNELEK